MERIYRDVQIDRAKIEYRHNERWKKECVQVDRVLCLVETPYTRVDTARKGRRLGNLVYDSYHTPMLWG